MEIIISNLLCKWLGNLLFYMAHLHYKQQDNMLNWNLRMILSKLMYNLFRNL